MELNVSKGRGYVSQNKKTKTEDKPIATIPVDSIYTLLKELIIKLKTQE